MLLVELTASGAVVVAVRACACVRACVCVRGGGVVEEELLLWDARHGAAAREGPAVGGGGPR